MIDYRDDPRFVRRVGEEPSAGALRAWLREVCETRGISLERWCHRAGVAPSVISKFLNVQQGMPSLEIIHRLADAADMPRPGMRFPAVQPLPVREQDQDPRVRAA